ncbi:MAG: hypothetical protein O7D32_10665 [bacterium]|nr:hypothetical protein [bacterium]
MRNILHALLALLLWVVFGFYWYLVMSRGMSQDTKTAIFTLSALSILSALGMITWIYHNVRIYRKLGRRSARRANVSVPSFDYMGRWVAIQDLKKLRATNHIAVEVKTTLHKNRLIEEKIFRAVPVLRPPAVPPA